MRFEQRDLDAMNGRLLALEATVQALAMLLVERGALPKQAILDRLDNSLLVIEQNRVLSGTSSASEDHARERLEALCDVLAQL